MRADERKMRELEHKMGSEERKLGRSGTQDARGRTIIAEDLTGREMAERMGISAKTVQFHRSS